MPTLPDVLFGLGLPALAGLVLFFLGRRQSLNGRSATATSDARSATTYILGIAFLLTYPAVMRRMPRLPPVEADEWLYCAVLALTAISLMHHFVWKSAWFWRGASFAIVSLTAGMIVWLVAKNGWPIWETVGAIAGAGLAAVGVIVAVGSAYDDDVDISFAAALAVVSAAGSAAVGMSGIRTYGQLAAALPAALFPCVILAIPLKTKLFSPDCLPMFVLLYGGLLLCGYLYAEPGLTLCNALLLFFAPIGLCVTLAQSLRRQKLWLRGAIVFAATALPAAIAFALALRQFLIDLASAPAY